MKNQVLCYLHTHWDREWYKTFEEYRLRLVEVLDDVFEKLENKEINCFYLDGQTIALEDYLEIFHEKENYVKKLIKEKKLFIGPCYVMVDEFLVNGASLLRNMLLGINYSKKFNEDEFWGYLPDAFGHNAYMPMILRQANIDKAIVWRGVKINDHNFFWQSPSKDKVFCANISEGYYQDFFAKDGYEKNVKALLDKFPKSEYILLPIGADHLACEDNIKEKISKIKGYDLKLSSLREYFSKINAKNYDYKTITGELRDNSRNFVLPSTFSSRVDIKQQNMATSFLLSKIVEPLYALLSTEKILPDKSSELNYAWKMLLQNHAHDSICGCALDMVHEENLFRYKKVNQILNALSDKAKSILQPQISDNNITLINLSNFDFSGVYEFWSDKKLPLEQIDKKKMFPISISQNIHDIPVQENYNYNYKYLAFIDKLKGFSIKTVKTEFDKNTDLKINEEVLENSVLKIKVNKDGSINIKNKTNGKCFKNLHNIVDLADVGDSYNFSCIKNDKPLKAEFLKSKILKKGNLRCILRLIYVLKIPAYAINENKRSVKTFVHKFITDISLDKNSEFVRFETTYENKSKDHILKLRFELPENITEVTSENSIGIVKREFDPDYSLKKALPKEKYKEANLNTSNLQRFLSVQGLCIFTKGLHEYGVDKNNLDITMLRCFGVIAKKTLLTRTAAAGPPLPTPDGQCLGKQKAQYALALTDESDEMLKTADSFYNSIITIQGNSFNKQTQINNQQLLHIDNGFYVYQIKTAENKNGIIIGIFNYENKKNTLNKNWFNTEFFKNKDIFEVNLLEEKLSDKNLAGCSIQFTPCSIKFLMICV